MLKLSFLVLPLLLTTTPSQAWMASLGFFKAPQSLEKSWTPQWANLSGYWNFENTWNDLSGNYHTGTPAGSASFTSADSKEGHYSASLDGGSTVAFGTILSPTYTKVAWIKLAANASSYSNNILSGGNNGQHAFWTNGCGNLKLSGGHNNGWGAVCDSDTLSIGVWYHVAITYNATTKHMALYKNGLLISSADNVDNFSGGGELELGGYSGNSNQFSGIIDEAAIWTSVLSPSDIQLIYNHQLNRH